MAAGYQDQYLEQGSDFTTELTLDDVAGRPFNLTGFSVRSQARKSYYSKNTTIVFNAQVISANSGTISLTANSAITANVAPGKLVYDVLLINDTDHSVTRVLEGQIFVSPLVTR
jgi:hypothetical protein